MRCVQAVERANQQNGDGPNTSGAVHGDGWEAGEKRPLSEWLRSVEGEVYACIHASRGPKERPDGPGTVAPPGPGGPSYIR